MWPRQPKNVTPATQAASEFMQETPAGNVPMALVLRMRRHQLASQRFPLAAPIPRPAKLIGSIRKPASPARAFLRNGSL
jgi:hypothetical protein